MTKDNSLRSEKLLKNTFWAIFGYMVYAAIGFVSRSIFVNRLGDTINGAATLFNGILNLLSLTELGFSSAIAFHLYKPVAEKDYRKIAAILNLYKKVYRVVALSILIIGLAISPFLSFFINSDVTIEHLHFYFLLYVIRTSISYCYAYVSVLFSVSQESYVTSNITNAFLILTSISQALILHYTANFKLYLFIWIVGTLLTNIYIYISGIKKYPYIIESEEELNKEEISDIFNFVKATAVDKVSSSVKTSTDTIITSSFVDIITTGIVGNYNMIISTVVVIMSFFFNNVIPSVGNLISLTNKKSQYSTLKDLCVITFWIYGVLSVGMLTCLTPFVTEIWLKKASLALPFTTVVILVFNFYIYGVSWPVGTFFIAKGYVKKMPYTNVINVIANLILSVLLVKKLGVNGVYIGTVISFIITSGIITPYYVFTYHFDKDYKPYLKLYAFGNFVNIFAAIWCVILCGMITYTGLVGLILKGITCIVIYNIIFVLFFIKTKEFQSIITLAKRVLLKKS